MIKIYIITYFKGTEQTAVPKPMHHRYVILPFHVIQDAGKHATTYQQLLTALPVLLMSHLNEPFYEIRFVIKSIRLNINIIIVDPSWDQTILEQINIFVC